MEDKYRWHKVDLDNLELPQYETRVLFEVVEDGENIVYSGFFGSDLYDKPMFFNDDCEGYVTKAEYPLNYVIAWRYCDSYSKGIPKYI